MRKTFFAFVWLVGALLLARAADIDNPLNDASKLTTGTLPNARLSAVPNSALANSSITHNGVSVALGGSYTSATLTATPSNPTGTTSTTQVMAGINQTITPSSTGKLLFVITLTLVNSTAGDGCSAQIRTGTGTPPTNGAALTGTTRGGITSTTSTSANLVVPASLTAFVSGFAVSTALWVDIGFNAVTGGTCTPQNISVSVIEL